MKTRVAVIYGGRSGEHEISLRSAKSIIEALDPEKYKVLHYLIRRRASGARGRSCRSRAEIRRSTSCFPVLHGTFGEDGTVQGLLELADLPYVGAGVLASSVSMDKEMMKRVCRERGLPVVDYFLACRGEHDAAEHLRNALSGVREAGQSGIVGGDLEGAELRTSCTGRDRTWPRVRSQDHRGARHHRARVRMRGARATTTPIASVPCEILPSREFYDYDDKYLLDQAQTVIPADLSPEQTAEMQRLAVECYRAVECEGMARVDFLLETATGKLYINEINTIPGFTSISMYPKMWEYSGLAMPKLIDRLIELALERHAAKRRLRYSK